MSRRARPAFTLVELLVVITVIAMLMALLIPAANMVIEGAKRTNCMNNMREIGQACLVYETAKQHFPPEHSNMNVKGISASWPALLVGSGYMGRGDMNGLNDASGIAPWTVYMPVFVCPSNPPDQQSDTAPTLSYACNAGKKNAGGSASMPSDWKDNGVFMEYMKGQMTDNVTKDFINRNDGLATTLLAMETLTAGDWGSAATTTNETLVGMVWPHSYKASATDDTRVNDPYVLKNVSSITQSTISCKHPGGANVVFCDGHPIFLSENVDPVIIEYAMTPNGKAAKAPGSTTITPQTVKTASGKTYFSEADLVN